MIEPKPRKTIKWAFQLGVILWKIVHFPRYILYKMFDFLEWDVRHAGVSVLIGIILLIGVINAPHVWQWQYWVFLLGAIFIYFSAYMKGNYKGEERERRLHSEYFMCIPKEVIIKQAEAARKQGHEGHFHIDEEELERLTKEKKKKEEKLPN